MDGKKTAKNLSLQKQSCLIFYDKSSFFKNTGNNKTQEGQRREIRWKKEERQGDKTGEIGEKKVKQDKLRVFDGARRRDPSIVDQIINTVRKFQR